MEKRENMAAGLDERLSENMRDKIRGCLFGGAIGDALGYPVEFVSAERICEKFGSEGIKEYWSPMGKAVISDDTQMTLFTANGLLFGATRARCYGISGEPEYYIGVAYKDWHNMQTGRKTNKRGSWLCDVAEMGAVRAPGGTCMSAIESGHYGSVAVPNNHSKGCGGVMGVAPIGLFVNCHPGAKDLISEVDRLSAESAALTHGHELGYMPAAMLGHIINRITYGGCKYGDCLRDIVKESIEAIQQLYSEKKYIRELQDIVQKALALSTNDKKDLENIRELGEGWVAEETLAIALYCCLKYEKDFSKAICAAVNHGGDSDSTGAVTGNILGALLGYDKIPQKWKENLECSDVILEIADDLWRGRDLIGVEMESDETWMRKYVDCKR